MATKKSRSNVSQAPENLPNRRESAKNGVLNPDAPLTEMQRQFVAYFVDQQMTQTAAARAAGFAQPGTAANQMMQHPKIERAIAERRAEYAAASQVTKKKVIDGFLESIEMAKIKADPLTMIAGWREVGKMCGFYEPSKAKIEVSVNGQVLIQRLNTLSDEELLKIAEGDPDVFDAEVKVIEDGDEKA
jgi:phage terminase small subunit